MNVCLVTGASGFIGRPLCQALRQSGYQVVGAGRYRPLDWPDEQWRTLDLEDPDWPNDLLDGVSHCIHLAAIADTGIVDPARLDRVNRQSVVELHELAQRRRVRTFVFISSILAADPNDSAYARTKYLAEQSLKNSNSEHLKLQILRPAVVYGPGVRGNLHWLMRAVASGWLPPPPRYLGHRPMVSVADLISAIQSVIDIDTCYREPKTICDGERYSIFRLVSALNEGLGRKPPRWHVPAAFWYAAGFSGDLVNRIPGLPRLPDSRTVRRLFAEQALPDAHVLLPDWSPRQKFEVCVSDMWSAYFSARRPGF